MKGTAHRSFAPLPLRRHLANPTRVCDELKAAGHRLARVAENCFGHPKIAVSEMLNITCEVMRHFALAPIPQMQPVAGFVVGLHIALWEAFDALDDETGEPADAA